MSRAYAVHILVVSLLLLGSGSTAAYASVTEVAEWTAASINSSCVSLKEDGRVYCLGGRSATSLTRYVSLFDATTNRPGFFADTFPIAQYANGCATDSQNNQIYCFGGYQYDRVMGPVAQDTIFKINPSVEGRKRYQKLPQTLPAPTAGLSCVEVPEENKIYCFGGYVVDGGKGTAKKLSLIKNEGGQAFANYAFSFHLDTHKTEVITAKGNIAADDLSCVYASGKQKVYCFGGDQGSYKTFVKGGKVVNESLKAARATIFSFDPARKRFSTVRAELPGPLSALSCASSREGKIYCFGGTKELRFDGSGDLDSRQIIVFNPVRETVSISKDILPYPIAGHSCVESPLSGRTIYCFGGTLDRNGNSAVIEYSPNR